MHTMIRALAPTAAALLSGLAIAGDPVTITAAPPTVARACSAVPDGLRIRRPRPTARWRSRPQPAPRLSP